MTTDPVFLTYRQHVEAHGLDVWQARCRLIVERDELRAQRDTALRLIAALLEAANIYGEQAADPHLQPAITDSMYAEEAITDAEAYLKKVAGR